MTWKYELTFWTCGMGDIYVKIFISPLMDLLHHLVSQSEFVKVLGLLPVVTNNHKNNGVLSRKYKLLVNTISQVRSIICILNILSYRCGWRPVLSDQKCACGLMFASWLQNLLEKMLCDWNNYLMVKYKYVLSYQSTIS